MRGAANAEIWIPPTVPAILERAATQWPDSVALICGTESLTYSEYHARACCLAQSLVAIRATGRHVAIVLRNSIDIAVAIFGAQTAGAASATLNPDYTPRELAVMLDQVDPVVILTHEDLVGTLQPLVPDTASVTTIAALLANGERGGLPMVPPDDIAVLQFTGGTTGVPKGAMLSHRAVASNVAQREAVLPTIANDERVVCMMPLYHSFAAAMCLHLTAYAGGALHILPRYRPDWVLDCIKDHGITRLPAGPTVFNSLLGFDGLTREQVESVRCAYSGSAPLPRDTLERWEAKTGVPIYEGYGQSEAGPILTYHGPDMPLKQGSVGPALPLTTLKIAGDAAVGEILARGPQIMDGYLNRPAETREALVDGWLCTGDIGRLDEDRYLFIEDRKKDMVITGGYNVYPREIDEVLLRLGTVREAGTVGVPDNYRGEVIWSFLAADQGDEDAIRAHCHASLVKYKQPARILFMESLPKTNVGKIDKQALKLRAREIAGDENHVA